MSDKNANSIKGKLMLSIISIFIISIAKLLIEVFKINPKTVWDVVDTIGRKFNIKYINDYALSNQDIIDSRVERDVTDAIENAKIEMSKQEPDNTPIFTEKTEGETSLGGEMRLQSHWNKTDD